jgi:hypothetical protein
MMPVRPSSPILALRAACALGVAAALSIGAAGVARAQPQSAADAAQRARELFRKAAKEYKAGQVNEAYRDYLAAWQTQQSPDAAGNLATIELELGYLRDAAEHASYAIAHFPPSGSKDQRAALVTVLTEAKKQIGALTIQVSVPGAAVSIDGRPIGRAPLDGEVYIEPGDHTIRAEAPDYDPAEQKIHVDKGSASPVALVLPPRSKTSTPTPAASNWPRPVAVAGFITAGVGLGVGTALAILAKIKASDAGTASQSIEGATHGDPGACLPGHAGSQTLCASLLSAQQSRDTFANAALWTFVGAAAVAAGTVIYTFVVPRVGAPPPASGTAIVPVVTPQGGAIVVRTSF